VALRTGAVTGDILKKRRREELTECLQKEGGKRDREGGGVGGV